MQDYIVRHPKLHLAVGGKLQHVKPGTVVKLAENIAKKLGGKLEPVKPKSTVVAGDQSAKSGKR